MFHEPRSPKHLPLLVKLPVIATGLFGSGHLSFLPSCNFRPNASTIH